MLNKDKIQRLDIYNESGKRILSTKAFTFPRDFFKLKGLELVSVKANGLPVLSRNEKITAIFEYFNGTRIQCDTKIDISTPQQMNFHVDEGIVLEERRGSFKVTTPNAFAKIIRIERGEDDVTELDEPMAASIININLTGILMHCEPELRPGDIAVLIMLDDPIEIHAEIIRLQRSAEGSLEGYGCRFLNVTPSQEEKIARYIFDCQLSERERRRNESR